MDRIREGGCHEVEEEYEVQELENLEKRKFILSLADLKDLCRVGILALSLAGSVMLSWAAISPHWAQLSYADRVVFSSFWKTCGEGGCWKPGDSAGYLIYGRCLIIFAVVFAFFMNLMLLGFFFQLCAPFPLECLMFAIMDTITGIAVFTGLLMYVLQMKSLEGSGPKITFLWPFFITFISLILFLYSAILFILIHKEFCLTKCLRSSRVIPKDPNS
ncbi:transmembrane protein 225B-like isoform X1 [Trichosurus vulpecula]|uniref:transmembrane protein 225B-like isoform X1 n=1 Tax=Trichosurus vulpecula TaxID=9337 RepID=UPI00186AFCA6|nr:transmembrane protein 225B-like isoform X1 [Trichosurus vulpecula]